MGTILIQTLILVTGIAAGVALGRLGLTLFFALATPLVTRPRT